MEILFRVLQTLVQSTLISTPEAVAAGPLYFPQLLDTTRVE